MQLSSNLTRFQGLHGFFLLEDFAPNVVYFPSKIIPMMVLMLKKGAGRAACIENILNHNHISTPT